MEKWCSRDVCGGTGEQIKHDIADKCQKQNLDSVARACATLYVRVHIREGRRDASLGISHKFQRARISRPVYCYWKYRPADVFTRSISVSKHYAYIYVPVCVCKNACIRKREPTQSVFPEFDCTNA